MRKKLTLSIDPELYDSLYRTVGQRNISSFIEDCIRPILLSHNLRQAYKDMSQEEERRRNAAEWLKDGDPGGGA